MIDRTDRDRQGHGRGDWTETEMEKTIEEERDRIVQRRWFSKRQLRRRD